LRIKPLRVTRKRDMKKESSSIGMMLGKASVVCSWPGGTACDVLVNYAATYDYFKVVFDYEVNLANVQRRFDGRFVRRLYVR
jgi:hypothetical protein